MSMHVSAGRSGASGDRQAYLWLAVGILVLIVGTALLVVTVLRAADDNSRAIAELGLPAPGAIRATAPAAATATVARAATATPVSAPRPTGDAAWWFAGIGETAGLSTTLALFNPGDKAVTGAAAYFGDAGPAGQITFTVPPVSRVTLGGSSASRLAVSLSAGGPFYAERLAVGAGDGAAGGGVWPATSWYLPVIETRLDYSDTVVIANFNAAPARVSLSIFSDTGITQTLVYTVPASSRLSAPITWVLAPFSYVQPGRPRGALVRSELPIVVEQNTVTAGGGLYGVAGAPDLAKTWYLPEGNTRSGFETTLAVLNPGSVPARLLVTYFPEGKAPSIKSYTVGAFTPLWLDLNAELPDAVVGTTVESDQPVAVQRVTLMRGGQGAHASVGATATAREWFLPDVSMLAPADSTLVVLNPGTTAADVTATFFGEDGRTVAKLVSVPAASRLAFALGNEVPASTWSARIASSQPVVVERVTIYRGRPGGISSLGIGR